jgi:hypothetical protein
MCPAMMFDAGPRKSLTANLVTCPSITESLRESEAVKTLRPSPRRLATIAAGVLAMLTPALGMASLESARVSGPSAERATQREANAPAASKGDAASLITEASVHAIEFDLPAATTLLRAAAARGERDAQIAVLYAQGLIDAREAARRGGTAESLAPVRAAIASLEAISKGRPGTAEIARLMLHAAAAAAQSERDEMRLYIESATRMEAIQMAAGMSGAPLVTASETAGDLWLLVHQYDEARRAYDAAGERLGSTLRILAGRARAARGANDVGGACEAYRSLLDAWGERPGQPAEIAEARAYSSGLCAPPPR